MLTGEREREGYFISILNLKLAQKEKPNKQSSVISHIEFRPTYCRNPKGIRLGFFVATLS